jgi:hypothetical protein
MKQRVVTGTTSLCRATVGGNLSDTSGVVAEVLRRCRAALKVSDGTNVHEAA